MFGDFICVFSREILAIKVVYRWMNVFKLVMHSLIVEWSIKELQTWSIKGNSFRWQSTQDARNKDDGISTP